jgi:phage protein D
MPGRTPFYQVSVEGQDITPWVNSVSVVEDDRQADNCSIAIQDPRMVYADALFEGCIAEVDIGYAEAGEHGLLLRATITKIELSYPENGVPALTLKGEDKSIMMGLVERNVLHRQRKVTQIVRAVAEPYHFASVEARLQNDPDLPVPVHQDGKTDLAFLQELAEQHHAKCFVELDEHGDEVLYFIPERQIVALNRPDQLVLRYRLGPDSNLISFSPSFDSSYIDRIKAAADVDRNGNTIQSRQPAPPQVEIWPLDEARLGQTNPRDRALVRALYDRGADCKREFQRLLTERRPEVGRVARDRTAMETGNDTRAARQNGMSATGSTAGTIWLRAKSNVTVQGVSRRFDGEWYVSSVTHKVDTGGYKTDFKCVR